MSRPILDHAIPLAREAHLDYSPAFRIRLAKAKFYMIEV
jgi:hypothetical protein